MNPTRPHPRPLLLACAFVALGLPGVLSLLMVLPEIPGVPRAAMLINPFVLLLVFAFLGAFLAPRCGFNSRIADRLRGSISLRIGLGDLTAMGIGGGLGVAIAIADQELAPLWQLSPGFPPSVIEAWSPIGLLVGVLYGGIVEEITMRWGLMSLTVWALWRLFHRRSDQPPQLAVIGGIVIAALVFAVGHLPVLTASGIELNDALVARTVGFNMVAGLIFGWLFAVRDIESAMLGHAGFHLGAAATALMAAAAR